MCEFEIVAEYCQCRDMGCMQKVAALGETQLKHAGHILKIVTCFRTHKLLCTGTFRNTNADRLLVRYGMDPNNANSTQDCSRQAHFIIAEKTLNVQREVCEPCKEHCRWFGSPAPPASATCSGEATPEL